MLPTGATAVLKAANRFKKAGAAIRAREEDEREENAAKMKNELEANGGIGALLTESRENRMRVENLQQQMEATQAMIKAQFEELNTQLHKLAQ